MCGRWPRQTQRPARWTPSALRPLGLRASPARAPTAGAGSSSSATRGTRR
ncbi:hypothetical protein BU14_0200s0039 [Porphyra umbilicalis]|uniref:Uncharacterized protein n=1 Tax=Porphyra umbilicalis TaxID=2786 RepID=A0A1X6P6M3_PORUM|nr:hypothetical protein BU14_0200s0039 [Porphyra umbilicalis]|eukprot:OSX76283.1 hypothetical protein BU14_0200s0039 [Porphyra umbilicalis]